MTSTTEWIAKTIREGREQHGWTQSDLARRLGRTQTAVSYWESGKRVPGFDDVFDIARALDIPVETFIPPPHARQPVSAVLRATAERLADGDLQIAVDQLLSRADQATSPPALLTINSSAPAHAANELLEKAGVEHPPVDVDAVATDCGVLVFAEPFPDSLSGLVFAHGSTAVIGINSTHPPTRRRFSLAHELGHFLLGHHHEGRGNDDAIHIDSSDAIPPGYDMRAERAANLFAAELLMPRRFVSAAFDASPEPRALADQFEVSELAMGYRLVNLGLR